MADTRLAWGAEALWEALHPLLPGLSVEVAASLPSTNTTLIERARASGRDPVADTDEALALVRRSVESGAFGRRAVDWQPCLLVAERQTAGRGRMGRDWHAEPLASLTFSLALPLAPADWSGLSLAVGVALAEALAAPLAPADARRLALKWPNDLWLRDDAGDTDGPPGRKLGGVLIETVATGTRRLAVVGVGLNVRPPAQAQVAQWSSGLACLSEVAPQVTAPQVLAQVAEPLVRALLRFEEQGFAAFAAAFAQRDLLQGRAVTTTQPGAHDGIARGVASDGSLRLETAQGTVPVHSGEVSVRLRPSAGGAGC